MANDEQDLIRAARSGSPQAFGQIVRVHQARVRTYLDRLLSHKDLDLVDDLAQQAFLDAYRSLSAYDPETPFDYWLLRIAKNRALRFLRDDARRRAREGASAEILLSRLVAERAEAEAGGPADHERRVAALRACLETLPPRSARMVSDFYFRARRGAEIARHLGLKESAVWVTLLRIREALRDCIDRRLETAAENP